MQEQIEQILSLKEKAKIVQPSEKQLWIHWLRLWNEEI